MRLYFTWFGFYCQILSPCVANKFRYKKLEDASMLERRVKRNATHFRTNIYQQQGRFVHKKETNRSQYSVDILNNRNMFCRYKWCDDGYKNNLIIIAISFNVSCFSKFNLLCMNFVVYSLIEYLLKYFFLNSLI